jgi:hypothetical protein
VGAQEVRWDKGGMVRAGDYSFFYGKGNEIHQLGTEFFVHHRIVSAVKRGELIMNRMYEKQNLLLVIGCHIVLRGHWCNIFALNVHALREEKSDDSNYRFMRNMSRVSIIFPSTIQKFC